MDHNPVDQIKAELGPRLEHLIAVLNERSEFVSVAFFMNLHNMLATADSEEELIAFTIELSTCAFVGLDYSPASAREVDAFLAAAEHIAHAMTADRGAAH